MATCPVRFEFYCGEEELKYVHNVPRNLVTVGAQAAQKDAGYANLFVNTLQPTIKEHEVACLANSHAFCENCGSPRVTALQTPMWNKAIAVGLRHNHDISFIATQCKTTGSYLSC